jgi:hypothetical protein
LQLAALLRRWPATHCSLQRSCGAAAATRWTSQRCCDGQQRAGPRGVLLRCPATRWASKHCCDVRQRYNSGQRCAAVFLFIFFTRQLEKRKRMEKERSFDTYSLVSRLCLSLLWLVVRNAKLLVGCKKRKAPSNNTSSNSSNALLPVATTRVATTQEFQKHKKSIAFNMKQQGIEFF